MNNFTFHNPTRILFGQGRIADLAREIPATARVLRVMPNTPAMIGEGMIVFESGDSLTSEERAFAETLFGQTGAENRSVTDWMGEAQKSIAAQERRRKVPASQPRIFVGDEAKAWANQPLKNWLQAPKAP